MVERLAGSRVELGGSSVGGDEPSPERSGFQPTRYWRGPVWPILNWVIQRGLDRYGFPLQAATGPQGLIELGSRGGFWEHYSPVTGAGHGGENFAWTAGLMLDVLAQIETATDGEKERGWRRPQDGTLTEKALSNHERRE